MKAINLKSEYADNRFMSIGVELQMNANSWKAAKKEYQHSCMLCCTTGCGAVQCAHCPIREAMLVNAIIFRKKLSEQDLKWVMEEKELL